MKAIIKGIFVDTPKIGEFRIRDGSILIEKGKIISFTSTSFPIKKEENIPIYDYTGKIILPGLIDLHTHAPQYSYAATSMDLKLLDWLNNYTFPEESKYKDINYAKENYKIFIDDCIKSPTSRFCMFGTLHTDATLELMDQIEKSGLVAYVGKLNMDRNSPEYYIESPTEYGVKETLRWIEQSKSKNYKNVFPIITPRFTPSTSNDYMKQLGEISNKYNLPVQSHLSENKKEIKFVQELCPDTNFYGETYNRYDLFGGKKKTVMAHCVYCSEEEKKLIKENGVFIAHCPTSNCNISTGICPAAEFLRGGYNIGIGTDVAGGETLNLFEVIKCAIQSSKIYCNYSEDKLKPLTIKDAIYLATYGGGKFFGDNVGLFDENFEFDAIVLDESQLKSNRKFDASERVERFSYLGNGKILSKFVRGKKLF